MAIYYVQQKATVWQQVMVEADDEAEAMEFGLDALRDGEGIEAEDSFEWQYETCLLNEDFEIIAQEGDEE